MQLGLDYSARAVPAAEIAAGGYGFVLRYVDLPGTQNPKLITPLEYRDLLAHGITVWLVFEQWTTDALTGWAGGVAHARQALAGANALGYTGVIFMAADMHMSTGQLPTDASYFQGAASVLGWGRLGVYGFSETVAAVPGAAAYWLCGHDPGLDSPVHIYQRNYGAVTVGGVVADVNELRNPLPGVTPAHGSEDSVSFVEFPATALPTDVGGKRWQDVPPMLWPRGDEQKTALVHAVPGGWRGQGSLASTTVGWAKGLTAGPDPLGPASVTFQDGPDVNGVIKPSGFIEYLRIFSFASNEHRRQDWKVTELISNQPLIGNLSLPQAFLPSWSTFLVVRYAAPGGLYLGLEYEH